MTIEKLTNIQREINVKPKNCVSSAGTNRKDVEKWNRMTLALRSVVEIIKCAKNNAYKKVNLQKFLLKLGRGFLFVPDKSIL